MRDIQIRRTAASSSPSKSIDSPGGVRYTRRGAEEVYMRRVLLIPILLLFAAAVPGAQSRSVSQQQRQLDIESELERLPTYGVFDFIRFDYDQGKVTLDGYSE